MGTSGYWTAANGASVVRAALARSEGTVLRANSPQPTDTEPWSSGNPTASVRSRWAYWLALFLLYLAAVLPRLRAAGFDEPDVTYGDEKFTAGKAEAFLRDTSTKITRFRKPPGTSHLLMFTFRPYYWVAKSRFGWQSIDDVQWWRVRRYWRSHNILLGGLVVVLAGIIGAGLFNMQVGLLAAMLCATSRRCAMWMTLLKEEALLALATTLAVYCAYRIARGGSPRFRWVLLGGIASGSAFAFKYNAAPVVPFFLLVLLLCPREQKTVEKGSLERIMRLRAREVLLYLGASAGAFLLWFPQLIIRPSEVWKGILTPGQIAQILDVSAQPLSFGQLCATMWDAWYCLFGWLYVGDQYPLYFFALVTVILAVVPGYAIRRRDTFVLCLWLFVAMTVAPIFYFWIHNYRMNHYIIAAIVPAHLLIAFGLDQFCEKTAQPIARRVRLQPRTVQLALLVSICIWPMLKSYGLSLEILNEIRGHPASRASRRQVVQRMPAGSRVFMTSVWRHPFVSGSLLESVHPPWLLRETADCSDLVHRGFDFACIRDYGHSEMTEKPPFLGELTARKVKPAYVLPSASHYLSSFSYVPIDQGEGESFHLSLYGRETSKGDFAGVRGVVPPAPTGVAEKSTRSLILRCRLYSDVWRPNFTRWEVVVDGKTVWTAIETSTPTLGLSETASVPSPPPDLRGYISDSGMVAERAAGKLEPVGAGGTPAARPNLEVTSGSVAPAQGQPGERVEISLHVQNRGNGAAEGNWTHVYLSSDESYSADDPLWLHGIRIPALNPGERFVFSTTTLVPVLNPGRYRVLVQCDVIDEVPESSEDDNVSDVGALQILGPMRNDPDLWLTTGSVVSMQGRPGELARVSLQVQNKGGNVAGYNWTGVHLSTDDSYSDDDPLWVHGLRIPPLNPGERFVFSTTTLVPALLLGQYHVIVYCDAIDDVAESAEDDNISNIGIFQILTPERQTSLSLEISARAGSEILIRMARTDFRHRLDYGWGDAPSQLSVSGLQLTETGSTEPLPIQWTYVGKNGGPGPIRYAMRTDWHGNKNPVALLDTGFEGKQPLVEAWRPYREVEPIKWERHALCRDSAHVKEAPGLGLDGSNALRLVAQYPPKESTTLGIMQPIAHPACREIRRIRFSYFVDGATTNRGRVALRLNATGLSLSGEYIDRAVAEARDTSVPNRWNVLELDVEKMWQRKHTRVDLIDFLEIAIEVEAGPRALFNVLIDNIGLA